MAEPNSPDLPARESVPTPVKNLLEILIAGLKEFVVVVSDEEGRFLSWHPGVDEQLGYQSAEFIGMNSDDLLPAPERERGSGRRELKRAAEDGRTSDTRYLVTKTGRHILVEGVTIALRDQAGSLHGFGKVLRDMTEQRNAEASLTAIARALDQSSVIVRQWNGSIDHWTAGCERLYGWSAQEAVGQICQDLLQTRFPLPLSEIQNELLATGTWVGELEHVCRNGRTVFVSTSWVLLSDPADEPLSVIETQTDVTSRINVQHALESANERLKSMALELERSNEELAQFARIASHDLSAPIISTRWLTDLLASRHGQMLDEKGRELLTQISQGLDRMSELVDAVLAHAQVGTSAIGSARTFRSEEAVRIAIDNLRQPVEVSGAAITWGSLPPVNIARQPLTQLFQNLLSNAIKYRRPGVSPEITIAALWEEACWRFSVTDNGMGIEPEWHQRIFQPMQRRHGPEIAGSGIGLATCKKIVDRAGGRIWVASEPGMGATFFFTLPGPPPA